MKRLYIAILITAGILISFNSLNTKKVCAAEGSTGNTGRQCSSLKIGSFNKASNNQPSLLIYGNQDYYSAEDLSQNLKSGDVLRIYPKADSQRSIDEIVAKLPRDRNFYVMPFNEPNLEYNASTASLGEALIKWSERLPSNAKLMFPPYAHGEGEYFSQVEDESSALLEYLSDSGKLNGQMCMAANVYAGIGEGHNSVEAAQSIIQNHVNLRSQYSSVLDQNCLQVTELGITTHHAVEGTSAAPQCVLNQQNWLNGTAALLRAAQNGELSGFNTAFAGFLGGEGQIPIEYDCSSDTFKGTGKKGKSGSYSIDPGQAQNILNGNPPNDAQCIAQGPPIRQATTNVCSNIIGGNGAKGCLDCLAYGDVGDTISVGETISNAVGGVVETIKSITKNQGVQAVVKLTGMETLTNEPTEQTTKIGAEQEAQIAYSLGEIEKNYNIGSADYIYKGVPPEERGTKPTRVVPVSLTWTPDVAGSIIAKIPQLAKKSALTIIEIPQATQASFVNGQYDPLIEDMGIQLQQVSDCSQGCWKLGDIEVIPSQDVDSSSQNLHHIFAYDYESSANTGQDVPLNKNWTANYGSTDVTVPPGGDFPMYSDGKYNAWVGSNSANSDVIRGLHMPAGTEGEALKEAGRHHYSYKTYWYRCEAGENCETKRYAQGPEQPETPTAGAGGGDIRTSMTGLPLAYELAARTANIWSLPERPISKPKQLQAQREYLGNQYATLWQEKLQEEKNKMLANNYSEKELDQIAAKEMENRKKQFKEKYIDKVLKENPKSLDVSNYEIEQAAKTFGSEAPGCVDPADTPVEPTCAGDQALKPRTTVFIKEPVECKEETTTDQETGQTSTSTSGCNPTDYRLKVNIKPSLGLGPNVSGSGEKGYIPKFITTELFPKITNPETGRQASTEFNPGNLDLGKLKHLLYRLPEGSCENGANDKKYCEFAQDYASYLDVNLKVDPDRINSGGIFLGDIQTPRDAVIPGGKSNRCAQMWTVTQQLRPEDGVSEEEREKVEQRHELVENEIEDCAKSDEEVAKEMLKKMGVKLENTNEKEDTNTTL